MKYEKFEEWMLHAPIVTSNGKKGVVADHRYGAVYIDFKDGTALWWSLWDVEFLEEKPSEEVGAQENSQIDWEVGQEVWCTILGKGVIDKISNEADHPITVTFEGGKQTYTSQGEMFAFVKCNRSLFFSEPVVTAELFPPKKPFVPILKKGDTVVVKWVDTTQVLIVREETERQLRGSCGEVWDKDPDVHFYKIGEEIKFQ